VARNRLDELVKAGNFSGNAGVGELKGANSNEERLRALADRYDQALEKGQRLAALDIVKAFGGDQLAANLAKDSGYLDKMIEAADEISSEGVDFGQRHCRTGSRAAEPARCRRKDTLAALASDPGVARRISASR
jgi:hypothetical protein